MKSDCSINFFVSSANLICRSSDISKYFREDLGLRDNESRLYCMESRGESKDQEPAQSFKTFLMLNLVEHEI